MWLPTNDDTKTIQYDTKFLKSSPGRYPALKWSVTKIEDTAVEGISMFTMAQTQFDSAKDNADLMIADYWESAVEPELPELEEIPTVSSLEIAYSGQPAVRAGGGFKKLTLKERVDGQLVDVTGEVHWSVDFSNGDITQLVYPVSGNPGKIKCLNDYSLIGKTFTVTAEYNGHFAKLVVEVVSL